MKCCLEIFKKKRNCKKATKKIHPLAAKGTKIEVLKHPIPESYPIQPPIVKNLKSNEKILDNCILTNPNKKLAEGQKITSSEIKKLIEPNHLIFNKKKKISKELSNSLKSIRDSNSVELNSFVLNVPDLSSEDENVKCQSKLSDSISVISSKKKELFGKFNTDKINYSRISIIQNHKSYSPINLWNFKTKPIPIDSFISNSPKKKHSSKFKIYNLKGDLALNDSANVSKDSEPVYQLNNKNPGSSFHSIEKKAKINQIDLLQKLKQRNSISKFSRNSVFSTSDARKFNLNKKNDAKESSVTQYNFTSLRQKKISVSSFVQSDKIDKGVNDTSLVEYSTSPYKKKISNRFQSKFAKQYTENMQSKSFTIQNNYSKAKIDPIVYDLNSEMHINNINTEEILSKEKVATLYFDEDKISKIQEDINENLNMSEFSGKYDDSEKSIMKRPVIKKESSIFINKGVMNRAMSVSSQQKFNKKKNLLKI